MVGGKCIVVLVCGVFNAQTQAGGKTEVLISLIITEFIIRNPLKEKVKKQKRKKEKEKKGKAAYPQ